MDIRTKLVLALVSSALLSMLLLGYLTYLLSFDLFLQNSGRQLAAIASSKSREIEHMLEHWQEDSASLANVLDSRFLDANNLTQAEREVLNSIITSVAERPSDSRWLGLFDARGKLQLADRPDLALPQWPVDAIGAGSATLRRTLKGRAELLTLVPLSAGYLAVAYSADVLDEIWDDRTGLGDSGQTLLIVPDWIDAEGSIQKGFLIVNSIGDGSNAAGDITEASEMVAMALRDSDSDLQQGSLVGVPVIASSRALADSGWRLLVSVDASEESTRVDELLAEMRSLGLSLGALMIFGGIFFGIHLSRRIRNLAETVERIRHGELDLRADVEGADEVALLARSFNEFLNQLDRSSDIFQLGALRVLVAENHPGSRRILDELLSNWRMRALLAKDCESALEALTQADRTQEPVQLIVLDESMPEMDGIELVEQLSLRKNWLRCPIIMLAEDPSALDQARLKRLGVGHVVAKPVVASDLMEAILDEMGVSAKALELISDSDVFLTRLQPRRILLVEDSPIIQRVTIGFLEKWGQVVTLAENGLRAFDLRRQERFDLILMDLEMPVMNGLQATLAIREDEDENDRIPIIALTARATKEDREQCMAAGMNDYIAKPVDPKVLYHLVESYPPRAASHQPVGDTKFGNATKEIPVCDQNELRQDESPRDKQPQDASRRDESQQDEAQKGADAIVDWQVARKLTGGDETLLIELAELFPEESDRHLDTVREGVAEKDAELVTRGAHSLKSAAGFFGASSLVSLALAEEILGKAADITGAAEQLPALEAETARLVAALKTFTATNSGD